MKRNRRVGMSFGTVVDKRYWYLLLPLGVLKISSKSRVMSVMFLYRIDYLTSQSYSVRINCIIFLPLYTPSGSSTQFKLPVDKQNSTFVPCVLT